MAVRQVANLLRTCAAVTRQKLVEPVQRNGAHPGSLIHLVRHFASGRSDDDGDDAFHRPSKPGPRSINPSERELFDALSAATGIRVAGDVESTQSAREESLSKEESEDSPEEIADGMRLAREGSDLYPIHGLDEADLVQSEEEYEGHQVDFVDYASEMGEGLEVAGAEGDEELEGEEEGDEGEYDGEEGEDEDDDEGDEFVDPLEAALAGVPRRMRRFTLQKMLKMKPTEAPSLSHWKRQYQMKVIDVNRTCKVTKGGGVLGFTAFVVCGNSNGAVGFGKGKSAEVSAAVDKAYSRSIRNLHYFERFEERTTFHPIVAKYEKTKVYLWPGKPGSGMVAGSTVGGILRLAGFKDIKSKVIGSRHPHNTVKATFKALSLVKVPPEIAANQGLDAY